MNYLLLLMILIKGMSWEREDLETYLERMTSGVRVLMQL